MATIKGQAFMFVNTHFNQKWVAVLFYIGNGIKFTRFFNEMSSLLLTFTEVDIFTDSSFDKLHF